jgi:hypothetical protein
MLETYRCLRCGYGWRTSRTSRPCKCPSCTSTSWDTPYIRDIPGAPRIDIEAPQDVIERLMKAAAEVLRTNSRCSVGKDLDNKYVVITPAMLPRWRSLPDRYGAVKAHLDRDSTADDLGQALFGRRWMIRAVT